MSIAIVSVAIVGLAIVGIAVPCVRRRPQALRTKTRAAASHPPLHPSRHRSGVGWGGGAVEWGARQSEGAVERVGVVGWVG